MIYAELIAELHKTSEFFAAGHGPLHALAANAIEHLESIIAAQEDREGGIAMAAEQHGRQAELAAQQDGARAKAIEECAMLAEETKEGGNSDYDYGYDSACDQIARQIRLRRDEQ